MTAFQNCPHIYAGRQQLRVIKPSQFVSIRMHKQMKEVAKFSHRDTPPPPTSVVVQVIVDLVLSSHTMLINMQNLSDVKKASD